MKVPNRAHATSKLEKRKLDKLITHHAQMENLAYNSFEEAPAAEKSSLKQLAAVGQSSNAHHSLSMFDSEAAVNKVH